MQNMDVLSECRYSFQFGYPPQLRRWGGVSYESEKRLCREKEANHNKSLVILWNLDKAVIANVATIQPVG